MQSGFSIKDRERLLRWLRHGAELAQDLKQDRATHIDVIWLLFQDAVTTMDRMPDQEKSWLSAGLRSGGWSLVGMSMSEAKDLEQMRYLCMMQPHDGPSSRPLMRDDEQRSLDVLCFLRWCGMYVKSKKPLTMQKAALALARGGDSEVFHRVWADGQKILSRAAVSKFRQVFVGHILAGLREDCGIVPLGGVSFGEDRRSHAP